MIHRYFCSFVITLLVSPFVSGDYVVTVRNAYFDAGVNRVVRLSDTGAVLAEFLSPAELVSSGMSGPTGLHFRANGNLVVSSTFGNELLEFDPAGSFVGTFAPTALPPMPAFDGPTAVAALGGELLVANIGTAGTGFMGDSVSRIDLMTGDAVGEFGSGHLGAAGILIDGDDVYVSAFAANQVLRFDGTGALQETITDPLIAGPTGLAIDPVTNDLLIASVNGDRIVRYDGSIATEFLATPEMFFPSDVHFVDDTTYLVSSAAAGSILQYTVGNPVPTPFLGFADLGLTQADLLNGVAIGDIVPLRDLCDFDGDGICGIGDLDLLTTAIADNSNDSRFDLSGDNVVDVADRDAWLAEAGNLNGGGPYLVADANLDGVVDVADFNLWNAGKFTATSLWSQGDFNADGTADVSDFNLWNQNKFQSSTSLVPEPHFGLGVLVLLFAFAGRPGTRR